LTPSNKKESLQYILSDVTLAKLRTTPGSHCEASGNSIHWISNN